MEPRKSTPRNKVYPEGEGAFLTQRPSSRASSAAPADDGGSGDVGLAALQLEARAKTEGRATARSLLHFYVFKVLPPVGAVSVVLFAVFAGVSYAVPRLLCHQFAVESSVRGPAPSCGRRSAARPRTESECPASPARVNTLLPALLRARAPCAGRPVWDLGLHLQHRRRLLQDLRRQDLLGGLLGGRVCLARPLLPHDCCGHVW